jgi:hypothetical protein
MKNHQEKNPGSRNVFTVVRASQYNGAQYVILYSKMTWWKLKACRKIVLAQHNWTGCGGWWKAQQRCAPAEKSVINRIWLLLSVSHWPIILIGPGSSLFVVPHLFAVQFQFDGWGCKKVNNKTWMWKIFLQVAYWALLLRMLLHMYLSMKEGSLFVLFCTYEIHWTRMLQIAFLVSLESSQQGGVHQLGFMSFGLACRSSSILNDFFTEN